MQCNDKKGIIVFSGYNNRAVLAFLRTISKYHLNFYIIAKDKNDDIFQTQYYTNVIYTRTCKHLAIKELHLVCKEISKKDDIVQFLIAPSTEFLNRFMLENLEELQKLKCTFPTVAKDLYSKISDKYSFGMICEKYDINAPKEYHELNKANIPFVAKPRRYKSSDGNIYIPLFIQDENDFNSFVNNYKTEEFYYQQFIYGKSIYLLYYIYKDGTIFKFSQENLIQQEEGKSILLARSSDYHHHNISKKFENLFIENSFCGLIMVEIKIEDNDIYMIEANPRFWGPSQLFVDANINFFEAMLYEYGFLQHRPKYSLEKDPVYYFWDDGISKDYKTRDKLAYYGFTAQELSNQINTFMRIELYNRKDSIMLFDKENQ